MGIKVVKHNYRVVVEPRGLGDFGFMSMSDYSICPDETKRNERYRAACEEIYTEIKRHIDGVGHVGVEYDVSKECEHCGHRWTEPSETYNGGCCEEDEKNADSLQ